MVWATVAQAAAEVGADCPGYFCDYLDRLTSLEPGMGWSSNAIVFSGALGPPTITTV